MEVETGGQFDVPAAANARRSRNTVTELAGKVAEKFGPIPVSVTGLGATSRGRITEFWSARAPVITQPRAIGAKASVP